MRRFGAPGQIESLRTVLHALLELHFPTLSVGQIVASSFVRRHYEAEIVNSKQGRSAWLTVTEEDLCCAANGDATSMRESLTRFFQSVGFMK